VAAPSSRLRDNDNSQDDNVWLMTTSCLNMANPSSTEPGAGLLCEYIAHSTPWLAHLLGLERQSLFFVLSGALPRAC
jgi:hypothetical protein